MRSWIKAHGTEIRVDGRLLHIARLEADGYEFLDDPEPILDDLRKSQMRVDIFTFTQSLRDTSPKYRYLMEWDNFATLPVSTFEHWWNQQIKSYPRNRARQAEKKGVTLREVPFDDALVRGIWEVYNECPVRRGARFRHYGKSIEAVRSEEATFLDTSVFIGAFLGDQLIGFIKMTWDKTRTQANLMNIVSMMGHRDKAPTNALIAQAVRSCAERNIRYLAYQRFSYGKKKQDSLSHFKEINGFQRIEVPRYYVPLTSFGRAALRLGLHHELVDHLPEHLVERLREARSAWYNRKLTSVTEAS
jgi:hypothetical protein